MLDFTALSSFVAAAFKKLASPQTLSDPIPGLYNTLQFMFNNHRFMSRVQTALQRDRHSLLRFSLGPKTVYLVTGQQNVRAVFGRDLVHDVTNQEHMIRYALPTLYKMNPAEARRWEAGQSGVTKTPIPGTEHVPSRQRLWYNYEHIYAEYLGKPQYMKPLTRSESYLLSGNKDSNERAEPDGFRPLTSSMSAKQITIRRTESNPMNYIFGPKQKVDVYFE
ncbi:cytochrome P450 [Apiospora aurea]|uniref:Cytochrome P450 n=1 Tax=Apiospora aurea TaxID=335848 RepID=A0ABR1Q884_9PEZI